MTECRCPRVTVGMTVTNSRVWDDECPEHGVGSEYFRGLADLPYGYSSERGTTREEWAAFKRSGGLDDEEPE